MPYELDSVDESGPGDRTEDSANDRTDAETQVDDSAERSETGGATGEATDAAETAESTLGVPIPDDHVGAFVAEAFEDPERSTTWDDVVDAMVAPSARDAWEDLSMVERAAEVLSMATEYDRRAIGHFEDVPLRADADAGQHDVDEGLRCRRNADTFRNGVAAAYEEGILGDEEIVEALDAAEFETERIARREDLLEKIDGVHDVEYRPYGGTLFDDEEGPEPETEHPETW